MDYALKYYEEWNEHLGECERMGVKKTSYDNWLKLKEQHVQEVKEEEEEEISKEKYKIQAEEFKKVRDYLDGDEGQKYMYKYMEKFLYSEVGKAIFKEYFYRQNRDKRLEAEEDIKNEEEKNRLKEQRRRSPTTSEDRQQFNLSW